MSKHSLKIYFLLVSVLFHVNTLSAAEKETLVLSRAQGAEIQLISEAVLAAAYGKLGINILITPLPNSRSLIAADGGQVDGDVSRIAGIESKFHHLIRIPVAINAVKVAAFSHVQSVSINSPKELARFKLVCSRGVKLVELLVEAENLNCHEANNFEQALKFLQLKRADMALLPVENAVKVIRENSMEGVFQVSESLIERELFHYLHERHRKLASQLELVLREMENTGEIKEIQQSCCNVIPDLPVVPN